MSEYSWPAPFGYSLFCDDIRQEVFGKYSLMGIYSGDLISHNPFPITMPTFCIIVHYNENPEDVGLFPLELLVFFPGDSDDEPSHRQPIPVEIPPEVLPTGEGFERRGFIMPIRFAQFTLKQAGSLKVRMKRGDDIVKLGSLRVIHQPILGANSEVPEKPN